jgi:hypothetical protein
MNNDRVAWNVVNHTSRFENSMAGYHCPECGQFYMIAKYTIEGKSLESGEKYTLCQTESAVCCGKKLPTPLSFFDASKAVSFMKTAKKMLSTKMESSKNFELAHFKQENILN